MSAWLPRLAKLARPPRRSSSWWCSASRSWCRCPTSWSDRPRRSTLSARARTDPRSGSPAPPRVSDRRTPSVDRDRGQRSQRKALRREVPARRRPTPGPGHSRQAVHTGSPRHDTTGNGASTDWAWSAAPRGCGSRGRRSAVCHDNAQEPARRTSRQERRRPGRRRESRLVPFRECHPPGGQRQRAPLVPPRRLRPPPGPDGPCRRRRPKRSPATRSRAPADAARNRAGNPATKAPMTEAPRARPADPAEARTPPPPPASTPRTRTPPTRAPTPRLTSGSGGRDRWSNSGTRGACRPLCRTSPLGSVPEVLRRSRLIRNEAPSRPYSVPSSPDPVGVGVRRGSAGSRIATGRARL